MNPYDVMGVSIDASLQDIRRLYKKIAIENHPDKLQHVSDDERERRVEYFKNVTVAYHILMNEHKNRTTQTPSTKENWQELWEKMEMFVKEKRLWENVVHVATKYITKKKHTVKLPVTLEELYTNKQKKVEFILKDVAEPLRIHVDCEKYPSYHFEFEDTYGRVHIVLVEFQVKQHALYDLEDRHLVYTHHVSLSEYITGCDHFVPFLDGTDVHVTIPPFIDQNNALVLEGKGLDIRYDMYVYIHVDMMKKEKWELLSHDDQCVFLTFAKELY